jgi:hypothetical protein
VTFRKLGIFCTLVIAGMKECISKGGILKINEHHSDALESPE